MYSGALTGSRHYSNPVWTKDVSLNGPPGTETFLVFISLNVAAQKLTVTFV